MSDLVQRLRDMADRAGRNDYQIGHYWNAVEEAADALEAVEVKLAKSEAENTYLRGLVQKQPGWKCVYGHDIKTMAECPSGFPGCACADDLMAGEDAAFRRLRAKLAKARIAIMTLEIVIEPEVDHVVAKELVCRAITKLKEIDDAT